MRKLIVPGRVIFSFGFIALGILQFVMKDFAIGRPPAWPESMAGKDAWAYISGTFIILCAISIILQRMGSVAAISLGILAIVYSFILRHFPQMIHQSLDGIIWQLNAFKTLALAGGCFIIAVSFMRAGNNRWTKRGSLLLSLGIFFLAFFLILGGFSHFKFHDLINNFLIPAYIPFHPFFTYFAAVALLAGGAGILLKPTRRIAAMASGIMILLWFFLLHIPRAAAAPHDYQEWMGVFESFSFSGILFVLSGLSVNDKGSIHLKST